MPYKDKELRKKKQHENYLAHREERKQKQRQYNTLHKEQIATRNKKYRDAHKKELNEYAKEYRDNNREKINAYLREYRKANVEKVKEYNQKYRVTHKQELADYKKGRELACGKAHRKVEVAVRYGKLEKQPCEICGAYPAQAHHSDYNLPLSVMWLCQKHHTEWHMNNKPIYRKENYGYAESTN